MARSTGVEPAEEKKETKRKEQRTLNTEKANGSGKNPPRQNAPNSGILELLVSCVAFWLFTQQFSAGTHSGKLRLRLPR
jgi:hypothetical protein